VSVETLCAEVAPAASAVRADVMALVRNFRAPHGSEGGKVEAIMPVTVPTSDQLKEIANQVGPLAHRSRCSFVYRPDAPLTVVFTYQAFCGFSSPLGR
jgi:hypothetical protein